MRVFDNEFFWYWFVNIEGTGLLMREKLLAYFEHPSNLWSVSDEKLKEFMDEKQRKLFIRSRNTEKILESYELLQREQARFIDNENPDFPEKLRRITSPPHGIYIKGRLPDTDIKSLAVVGSRNPTAYGKDMTAYFMKELTKHEITVISGMANGIDAIAHRFALDDGRDTIGVIGGGIDTIYPRNNFNLYMDMYEKGCIISEYNLGIPNHAGLFPMRNRLISALSDGVFIIEAASRSGTLITADHALEQGKDVYVLPGRITDPLSKGCNHLIVQGARPVESPQDLLRDFLGEEEIAVPESFRNKKTFDNLMEYHIYNLLDEVIPRSPNQLKGLVKLSMPNLLTLLNNLELKGFIKQTGRHMYIKI